MTRAEHMRWTKNRALELLNLGNREEAITSMLSDLGKHEETIGLLGFAKMMGMFELVNGNKESTRKFIEGFAE